MEKKSTLFQNSFEKPYLEVMPNIISETCAVAKECADIKIDSPKKSMLEVTGDNVSFLAMKHTIEAKASYWSMSQLCQKAGIPFSFYQKLAQSDDSALKNLADDNLNTLISRYNRPLLIRMYKDIIRAVLSSRYSPFDTDKVVTIIDDTLKNSQTYSLDNLQICGYVTDYEELHIRLADRTPITGIEGSDVYSGLAISTSDIGKARLAINYYLFNKTTQSGLCLKRFSKDLCNQRHTGISEDSIRRSVIQSFENFPKLTMNARLIIGNAENFSFHNSQLYNKDNWQTKSIARYLDITDKDMDTIITAALTKKHNLWNYVMSITEFAKTKPFEQCCTLEERAGNILLYPDKFGIVAAEV